MNNINANIKTEDKKSFKNFIFITIIALILGGSLAFFGSEVNYDSQEKFINLIKTFLLIIAPVATFVTTGILIIFCEILYKKSKEIFYKINEDSEDDNIYNLSIEKIERNSYVVILFSNINIFISFFFFATWFSVGFLINKNFIATLNGVEITLLKGIFSLITLPLSGFYALNIQKRIINLKKEINPLLKGSIYDLNLYKKWLESSDESLKLNIYKSSYKSNNAVAITCIILLIILTLNLTRFIFDISHVAILVIILIVQQTSYYCELIKVSKANKK